MILVQSKALEYTEKKIFLSSVLRYVKKQNCIYILYKLSTSASLKSEASPGG